MNTGISSVLMKRIQNEQIQIRRSREELAKEGITITGDPEHKGDSRFLLIKIKIDDSTSIYKGHNYEISIRFGDEYPYKPPQCVWRKPRIFHANTNISTGEICLNLIKEAGPDNTYEWAWNSLRSIKGLAFDFLVFINSPCGESPLNVDAGNLTRDGDSRALMSLANYYYKKQLEEIEQEKAAKK